MSPGDDRNILKVYIAGRESFTHPLRSGAVKTHLCYRQQNVNFFVACLMFILYLAGQVVNLINDSPRVEGNNITVDLQTDHPVQCGIRLAKMASPLRDCECASFLLHVKAFPELLKSIQV